MIPTDESEDASGGLSSLKDEAGQKYDNSPR